VDCIADRGGPRKKRSVREGKWTATPYHFSRIIFATPYHFLVALMIQHRVSKLLTFNDAEFQRFAEIESLAPIIILLLILLLLLLFPLACRPALED
jgi:hypothetical protein